MFHFLDAQYAQGVDEVGGLLSGLALLPDGSPVDYGHIVEWKLACEAALNGQVDAKLEWKK